MPTSDFPNDRILDKTETTGFAISDIDWPEDDGKREGGFSNPHAERLIHLPKAHDPWNGGANFGGRPMQLSRPDKVETIVERDTYRGTVRHILVPVALDRPNWIEGMPTRGGAYDQHHVMFVASTLYHPVTKEILYPAGSTVEIIMRKGNTCLKLARFDAYGMLHPEDGYAVKGQISMCQTHIQRGDEPHRMSLSLNNYAKGRWNGESDGTGDWEFPRVNDWLRLDPSAIPAGLTGEAAALAEALVEFGVIISDIGGNTNLHSVSGKQWADVDWQTFAPKLGDFQRVEYRPLDYVGEFYPDGYEPFDYTEGWA